jgi:hypothetical protein
MLVWGETLFTCTLEEIFIKRAENRAWSKELRLRTNALLNTRLAKIIDQSDYLLACTLAREGAAECRRRENLLEGQIRRHAKLPLLRKSNPFSEGTFESL